LPVTPTGKLLRRKLKEMAAALVHSSSSGG
jgi:acyl-coenzyme A synthetase/AMP-(fatty) acid ligase